MMNNNLLLITILGMSLVTVLPRVIPVFVSEKIRLPKPVQRWLKLIPYAALGALIFPGVLSVDPDPRISIAGAIAAGVLAMLKIQLIYVIIGSIGVVMLLGMFL